MRIRSLLAVALGTTVLGGCGSSHTTASSSSKTGSSSTAAPPSTPPPQGPPATVPASAPPAVKAIAGRLLVAGDIPGLAPQGPPGQTLHGVILGINARSWVEEEAREGLPSSEQATETTRLERLGFVRGVHERLAGRNQGGPPEGLSIAIEFRSPSGAQANLQHEVKTSEDRGPKPFAVKGIPGAQGFGESGASGTGYNVAFAKGSYYYIVGIGYPAGTPGAPTREQLISAAQRLYSRLR